METNQFDPTRVAEVVNSVPNFESLSSPIQIALFMSAFMFLSAFLVSVTSFTRIVIVLSFVRRALTTQEIPPNSTVIGLALFMTYFTMGPVIDNINKKSISPYLQKEDAITAF